MIIDAQFGLLELGITARALRVQAPVRMSFVRCGVLEFRTPSPPRPSIPMTMTCSTPAIAAAAEWTNGKPRNNTRTDSKSLR